MTINSPSIVIVSSSLATESRSRLAAKYAAEVMQRHDCVIDFLDLAELSVKPYPESENDAKTLNAVAQFNQAHAWVLASPVYNFGMSGVLLNFLHYALDSDHGRFKPFVIIETMAGLRSAMANDHLARTMTYEVSAVQVGPAVYAVGDTGVNRLTGEIAPDVRDRIEKAMAALAHFARARMTLQS